MTRPIGYYRDRFCDDHATVPLVTKRVTVAGDRVVCAGCGKELPPNAGRGRPARFHGAACRQRAHRARLASERADAVAALVAVEDAVSEVRRALLTGSESVITGAAERLERATGGLFGRLRDHGPSSTPVVPDAERQEEIVTKPVTDNFDGQVPEKPTARRPRRPLTATPKRLPPVDVSTIRLVRREGEEPGWRVLAGLEGRPEVLGFLQPAHSRSSGRRSGRWDAISTGMVKLGGGPWQNRNEAIARLVEGRRIKGAG